MSLVVCCLSTIDQRTALYGHTSTVCHDMAVGNNLSDRHVEMYSHLVTLFPFAVYRKVTLIYPSRRDVDFFLPVNDGHSESALHTLVCERVER